MATYRARSCQTGNHAAPSRSIMKHLLTCIIGTMRPALTRADVSAYYASNCYEVGGGNMGPTYLKCEGCQYVEAFRCLDVLRKNVSGNVPTGCGMNVLTVQPDPLCCPNFEDPTKQRSIDKSTSAYPDALRCLEDAGCADDNVHAALTAECGFNQCNQEFACIATFSSAERLGPALKVVSLAWTAAIVASRFFDELVP